MSTYNDRNYIIFPANQLNLIDFSTVLETSANTVRKSVDNTKTFVKWEGIQPACISNLTNIEGPYTYSEILDILNTSEWTAPYTGSMA
jgi:hypothetical protein